MCRKSNLYGWTFLVGILKATSIKTRMLVTEAIVSANGLLLLLKEDQLSQTHQITPCQSEFTGKKQKVHRQVQT